MKKTIQKNAVVVVETLFSTCICAIGVALFVEVGLGSDTIDVFVDGLHRTLNVSLGRADQLFSIFFLVFALLVNRRYIGWPSILYTLLIGFAIDFFNVFIIPMNLSEQSFIIRFLCIILAQLSFGMSYAIFQTVERGMNMVDAVIYFFVVRFKLSYVWIRTSLDIVFFLCGFLLGGVIGIGTVLSACLTGITTRWLYKRVVQLKNNSKMYRSLFERKELLK
ncbi:MAG: hypothetical protein RR690_07125 [Longicatena sp.]